jgi:glycosyltransferase involved in cell wall biosynthesis
VRVAIVVSHPIQHYCPFYEALAADGRLQLKVFFASTAGVRGYFDPEFGRKIQWSQNLTEGYQFEFLPGAAAADPAVAIDNPALNARLKEWNPSVVQVYGFHHGISRRALLWAKRNRRRTLFVSDSELRTRRTWLTRVRKQLSVPLLNRLVDGFLTIGDQNEAYYSHYGVKRSALFRCPYPIDSRLFDEAWEQRAERKRRMRAALGIPTDAIALLTVGKLTTRKRPEDVLRAIPRIVSHLHYSVIAVLAGDGPERTKLELLAKVVGHDRVRVAGFMNIDQLVDCYLAADILVHPSEEDPHPLATSEAVFCGLPAVVSDRVGSVGPTDDVRIGENALEYPVGDIDALAVSIRHLVTDTELRTRMSRRSREIGRQRTLKVSVDGFVRAINSTSPQRTLSVTS